MRTWMCPNGHTVSAVDSSASWVNASRCEFKSSWKTYVSCNRFLAFENSFFMVLFKYSASAFHLRRLFSSIPKFLATTLVDQPFSFKLLSTFYFNLADKDLRTVVITRVMFWHAYTSTKSTNVLFIICWIYVTYQYK